MKQLLPFVNIADHILHCTQINLFELGNSTRTLVNVLMEIIFCFRDDLAWSTWKVRNVNHVFRAKIYAPIHIPASETSGPLATYITHALSHDFVARRLPSCFARGR